MLFSFSYVIVPARFMLSMMGPVRKISLRGLWRLGRDATCILRVEIRSFTPGLYAHKSLAMLGTAYVLRLELWTAQIEWI